MKLFLNLLGMGVAGFLGYTLEPNLRLQLTGVAPGRAEIAQHGKLILQLGDGKEQVDLESLTPEQLPEKILINSEVKVSDPSSGITMNIQAGNRVKLLRIEGANAIVSPGEGSYEGRIPVMDTDLLEQLAKNPPVPGATPPVKPAPTPVTPAPVTPPSVTPAPVTPAPVTPPPVAPPAGESAEPPVMPEPPPVPEPAPAPETAPTPDPVPMPDAPTPAAVAATGPEGLIQAMQESVKSAQIKGVKFDQVLEWNAGEPETVDGESFQTGTAKYKAMTFLGEKVIEAKAFIKNGKVQRWIGLRSGLEIK